MKALLSIAFRNLKEHQSKSLIIGTIIALGVVILVVGNSLMDTASLGIQRTFLDNYTGHVMISGKTDSDISLFGVQEVGGAGEAPTIPDYQTVRNYIEQRKDTVASTSQVTGFGLLSIEGTDIEDEVVVTMLFGIEGDTYHAMFDNIELLDGDYLESGEEGILLSEKRAEEIAEDFGVPVRAGDSILVTSFTSRGLKIQEVTVRGIFRFKLETQGSSFISYIDIQSLRALKKMSISSLGEIDLQEAQTDLLGTEDVNDLFSDDLFGSSLISEAEQTELSDEALLNIIDTDSEGEKQNDREGSSGTAEEEITDSENDTGSWEYILVKTTSLRRAKRYIRETNRYFEENAIQAQAADWKAAAGPFSTTADVLKTVFNIALLIVAVVAIIIIMNTLVISIIERTSEIGTMRALGAQKEFIWKMFLAETLVLTLVSGLIGIAVASLIVGLLNIIGIPATNPFLKILFAGEFLRPEINQLSLLTTVGLVMGIGILAHIYPVSVALKIEPVRAIQTE